LLQLFGCREIYRYWTVKEIKITVNKLSIQKIVDVLWEIVVENELGKLASGIHNTTLNIANLSSGIYFYTLYSGDKHLTKRMVVSK